MRRFAFVFALVMVAMVAVGSGAAKAATGISAKFDLPMKVTLTGTATGCDNRGSTVEIQGSIELGTVEVAVRLQNNVKGTHTTETQVQDGAVTITPTDPISIPKQPVHGGVGGNPRIWIQILGQSGNPLTGWLYAGRCVQGASLNTLEALLSVPAAAQAFFSGLDCWNHPGPNIKIDTATQADGINALVKFTNNTKGTHSTDPYEAVAGIDLAGPMNWSKSPHLGGAGGNPLVYGWFRVQGSNLTAPIKLGRCNKL